VKLADVVWEVMDNALYVLHLCAILLLSAAAVAVPALLWQVRDEIRALRAEMPQPCQCGHDDGPGPVLPRVLPRVRRIGEEAD